MIIRVMSYNVGHYNMGLSESGFPPELISEKTSNLKQLLMAFGPDLIGIQEDAHYLDRAQKIKSQESLWSPVWSFRSGYKAETLRTKFRLLSGTHELVNFSNGQHFRRGIFTIGGKRLLFVSCHPIARVGNSSKRKAQYTELFDHVRKSGADCCIITGDFNTTETMDKTNLTALCNANGFTMAIGQYLPWIDTYLGRSAGAQRHSFDNVLASKGLTIRTTRVLTEWYDRLFSDHVPVVADIEM